MCRGVTRAYIAGRAVPVRASIVAVCYNNNLTTTLPGDGDVAACSPVDTTAPLTPGSATTLLGFTVNEP